MRAGDIDVAGDIRVTDVACLNKVRGPRNVQCPAREAVAIQSESVSWEASLRPNKSEVLYGRLGTDFHHRS
jgi:hypothetical protein